MALLKELKGLLGEICLVFYTGYIWILVFEIAKIRSVNVDYPVNKFITPFKKFDCRQ